MKGTIEDSYDSTGAGRIVGEDGLRYDFEKSDCLGSFESKSGMNVEFEPSGGRATSVHLTDPDVSTSNGTAPSSSGEIQRSNKPGSESWLFVMIPFAVFFRLSSFYFEEINLTLEYFWIVYVVLILGVQFYILNRMIFAWGQVRRFGGEHLSTAGIIARAIIPFYQIYGIPSLYARMTDELNEIHGRLKSGFPKIDKGFAVAAGLLHLAGHLYTNAISDEFYFETMADPFSFYASVIMIGMLAQIAFGHMVLQRAICLERMQPLVATSSRSL